MRKCLSNHQSPSTMKSSLGHESTTYTTYSEPLRQGCKPPNLVSWIERSILKSTSPNLVRPPLCLSLTRLIFLGLRLQWRTMFFETRPVSFSEYAPKYFSYLRSLILQCVQEHLFILPVVIRLPQCPTLMMGVPEKATASTEDHFLRNSFWEYNPASLTLVIVPATIGTCRIQLFYFCFYSLSRHLLEHLFHHKILGLVHSGL